MPTTTIKDIRQQYPQYEDMSDEQLAKALHRKFYSDMDYSEFSQRIGLNAETSSAPDEETRRGIVEELGRQLGLTGRYIVEGVTGLPAMVAQPIADVGDLILEQMGSDFRFGNQAAGVSNLLNAAGVPQPEGAVEELVAAPSRALAGAASVVGAAQRMSGPVAQRLAELPAQQATGALGGGVSAEVARQMGAGPVVQFAAGLAGGVGAPLAAQGAGALTAATARGVRGAMQPFSASGREQIAGRVLAEQATDPVAAAANLRRVEEIVPGSQPTAGAASRDVGLLAVEKGLRSRNPSEFGTRLSEQNAARQAALDEIAGTPADIADDVAAREAATASAREAIFESQPQVNVAPILAKADEILASPVGARKPVQQAVAEFRKSIEGETDAARLYEIRKDIGDAMAGKYGGDKSSFKLARKELIDLRGSIDDAIESVAPGFKAYLDRYKEMSRPINQKEALQELQARSALAAPDVTTGRDFLSQAKFTRNLDNLLRDRDVVRNLTDEQIQTARAVAADLDLGAAINSPLIRAPGSDTFQNLSLANIVANAKRTNGDVPPLMKAMTRPFEWMYRYTDDQINALLVDAMLDPKLAARMLERATPKRSEALSNTLAVRARKLAQGATMSVPTQSQRQDREARPREQGVRETPPK